MLHFNKDLLHHHDIFLFQLFSKSKFFKTVKNLFKNQSQRVVLQGCSALVTFWTRFSARSCLHPNLFLPSSLHDKILRILGINIKNEKMSQNIENLIFFIREKLHLVGLFTFTKFEQHLSNIRMNRHISLRYLYSISLTLGSSFVFLKVLKQKACFLGCFSPILTKSVCFSRSIEVYKNVISIQHLCQ